MRPTIIGSAIAGLTLMSGASAPALAATPAQTYQGTWVSARDCTATHSADGRWTVVTKGQSATVSVTVFLEGSLHAAWASTGFVNSPDGATFDVSRVLFGHEVDFRLDGRTLTYTIDNLCPDGSDGVLIGTLR